ncbi:MAG: thiolase family protein [Candidatus Sericytochromatia bacterium]|nr:thiolase family protein [Candidatus Tanganyikabacteria bacterium]
MAPSATVKGFRLPGGGFGARYEGVVVAAGKRTAFGKFMGTLARVSPTDLGIVAARAALDAAGLAGPDVDQVVFANVAQSGPDAFYLPRHVALYAGVPREVPAVLVNRLCGSGLEVLAYGAEQLALGKARVALCGGTESMTRNPIASYGARLGVEMGRVDFVDTLTAELLDPACGASMGQTAENLAKRYGLGREDVDAFAFRSHQRGWDAWEAGRIADEIAPVVAGACNGGGLQPRKVALPRKVDRFDRDEHLRPTDAAGLAKLPPVFDGVQTAGNSSGIVDGAAAAVLCDAAYAQERGIAGLGRLSASCTVGVDPDVMGIGPAPAIRALLAETGLGLDDVDLFEINEAFGAQALAVTRELDLDPEVLNVNGGAIALGHPLAATGTRLAVTALLELARRGKRRAVASACIGGGQGIALLLERD